MPTFLLGGRVTIFKGFMPEKNVNLVDVIRHKKAIKSSFKFFLICIQCGFVDSYVRLIKEISLSLEINHQTNDSNERII